LPRDFGGVEGRTSLQETKKMQIKLATTCNKNEQQQGAPRILLNYWPNWRRIYGRPVKRPLDEAETGLSRSDC